MRRLWFVVVILIAVIGGLNSMSSSRRSASEEQAMRERIKEEVKAELQAELAASQPPQAALPEQPTETPQVATPPQNQAYTSPAQQPSEMKALLLQRLAKIDADNERDGIFGSSDRIREKETLLRALADIEMAERGASPQSIETVRQRRAADDTKQAMDEQSRQMQQLRWDMEQQRQQLEEQRQETERLQQAENHRKWHGE